MLNPEDRKRGLPPFLDAEALERAIRLLQDLKNLSTDGRLVISNQAWHTPTAEEMLLLLQEVTFLVNSYFKYEHVATLRRNPEIISTDQVDELQNEQLISRNILKEVLRGPDPEVQGFLQSLGLELERRMLILRKSGAGKHLTARDQVPFVQVNGWAFRSDAELEGNLLFQRQDEPLLQVAIFYLLDRS
jgi:hypothetical protein